MTRGRRIRIAPGIYRDDIGYAAQVMVRGRRAEKRFPLDMPLRDIKDWRDGERLKRRDAPQRGTLQADVDCYLETAKGMPTWEQRKTELQRWVAALGGKTPRGTITAMQVNQVMADWLAEGDAPQTVKLRRTALRRLYNVLDGKSAPNVVRDTICPQEPQPEARGHSLDVVEELFAAMPASEWRPRLKLLAYAGLPPKLLGQIRPGDVLQHASALRVPPRRKGKGAAGSTRPLTPQAIEAFQELDQMEAWGPFDAWRQHDFFMETVARVNAARAERGIAPLTDIHPYDLRHSFGTWLYEQTHDLATVARLLGVTLATARRYSLGAVNLVDVAAIAKLGAVMRAVNARHSGSLSNRR